MGRCHCVARQVTQSATQFGRNNFFIFPCIASNAPAGPIGPGGNTCHRQLECPQWTFMSGRFFHARIDGANSSISIPDTDVGTFPLLIGPRRLLRQHLAAICRNRPIRDGIQRGHSDTNHQSTAVDPLFDNEPRIPFSGTNKFPQNHSTILNGSIRAHKYAIRYHFRNLEYQVHCPLGR
jgi:hypothetical protein